MVVHCHVLVRKTRVMIIQHKDMALATTIRIWTVMDSLKVKKPGRPVMTGSCGKTFRFDCLLHRFKSNMHNLRGNLSVFSKKEMKLRFYQWPYHAISSPIGSQQENQKLVNTLWYCCMHRASIYTTIMVRTFLGLVEGVSCTVIQ